MCGTRNIKINIMYFYKYVIIFTSLQTHNLASIWASLFLTEYTHFWRNRVAKH